MFTLFSLLPLTTILRFLGEMCCYFLINGNHITSIVKVNNKWELVTPEGPIKLPHPPSNRMDEHLNHPSLWFTFSFGLYSRTYIRLLLPEWTLASDLKLAGKPDCQATAVMEMEVPNLAEEPRQVFDLSLVQGP